MSRNVVNTDEFGLDMDAPHYEMKRAAQERANRTGEIQVMIESLGGGKTIIPVSHWQQGTTIYWCAFKKRRKIKVEVVLDVEPTGVL